MSLKALCFLGTGPQDGRYSETNYVKHDKTQCWKTDLFPEAINQLYCPDEIIVFVTPQVQKGPYLSDLKKQLGAKLKPVELLDLLDRGNSEADMWRIFDTYQQSVEEGDKIILDITHGFRSLPMLAFPVIAYLRQVKKVELEHILYAPFDARPESKGKDTFIFDLTPFVTLLNWMNAVNVFQNSGDARPIARLDVPKNIDEALTGLSEALLTNRTLEAQKAAWKFNFEFSKLRSAASLGQPFQMLIDQLKQSYQQMAVNEPSKHPENSLKAQYQQIKWYMENQHYLQAITLIREWLISFECLCYQGHWLKRNTRDDAENDLKDCHPDIDEEVIDLWERCKIRGDLAHCGMRPDADSATQAIKAIEELFKRFKEYYEAIDWNNL